MGVNWIPPILILVMTTCGNPGSAFPNQLQIRARSFPSLIGSSGTSQASEHHLVGAEPSSDLEQSQTPAPVVEEDVDQQENVNLFEDLINQTMSSSDELSFRISREHAIRKVLFKVIQALGPRYYDSLPTAPTNATITTNSTIRVEACPEYYKRCTSQTFYPSCELPPATNEQMWNQRFTLYFNISSTGSDSVDRQDVLNATLRLYKNLSLPLTTPETLVVKLYAFTRSLRRNNERSILISMVRVSSDYVGWVLMDAYRLIKRLKRPANYGVKITVQNERNVPWNIPNLFVKMDCEASNETLIPLPFEILGQDTQRYPALNIRSGLQDSIEENDYEEEVHPANYFNPGNINEIVPHNRRHRQRGRQERPQPNSQEFGTFPYSGSNYNNYEESQVASSSFGIPSSIQQIHPIDSHSQSGSNLHSDELQEADRDDYFDNQPSNIWNTGDYYYDQQSRRPSTLIRYHRQQSHGSYNLMHQQRPAISFAHQPQQEHQDELHHDNVNNNPHTYETNQNHNHHFHSSGSHQSNLWENNQDRHELNDIQVYDHEEPVDEYTNDVVHEGLEQNNNDNPTEDNPDADSPPSENIHQSDQNNLIFHSNIRRHYRRPHRRSNHKHSPRHHHRRHHNRSSLPRNERRHRQHPQANDPPTQELTT